MTNPFFNNYNAANEQTLLEDLLIEAISIYGHEVYYVPRSINRLDEVYGEDALSTYESAHDLDVYIRSFDSFEGDGQFLSKFNLEIRDQITFTIARRTFKRQFEIVDPARTRPLEGDLVYSKMMKKLFIVKYVNYTPTFYQMGTLQTWDVVCEVFEYSNERIMTGIEEIDDIQLTYSFAGEGNSTVSNTGFESALWDIFGTNQEFNDEAADMRLLDFSETDPFGDNS